MLADSTNAMILLDRGRCIRRFTAGATALFSLRSVDLGRPIQDLSQNFHDPAFLPDILLVLEGRKTPRKEVQSNDGRRYVRTTLPYLLPDGTIEGAVIAFSDVDPGLLSESREYAEAIVNTLREPLLVLDAELCVHSINRTFSKLFEVSSMEVLGEPLGDLDRGVWDVPELLSLLKRVAKTGAPIEEFEVAYESKTFGARTLLLNARKLRRDGACSDLILVAIDDVTDRRRADASRVSTAGELVVGLTDDLHQPLSSISNLVEACSGYVRKGLVDADQHLGLLADIAAEATRAAEIVAELRILVEKGGRRPE